MTQSQYEDETNVNKIMKRYHADGAELQLSRNPGQYADLTSIKDYQGSLQTIINAQNAFNSLPSTTRNRFQNDPQQLLNFMSDENNYEEALKLNLTNPKTPQQTQTQTQTPHTTNTPQQTQTPQT